MASGRYRAGQGPFGGDLIGPNPTDRAKPGTKQRLVVEADGGPRGAVVAGANVHDPKRLAAPLDASVVPRPAPTPEPAQHRCGDKASDNPTGPHTVAAFDYRPHIRRSGAERWAPAHRRPYPARRWVVERTLAWLSTCRAILVRYDKHGCNDLGLIQLAGARLWYRRSHRLRVLR
jgi:putative transposase